MKRIFIAIMTVFFMTMLTGCGDLVDDLTDTISKFTGENNEETNENQQENNRNGEETEAQNNNEAENETNESENNTNSAGKGQGTKDDALILDVYEKALEAASNVDSQEVHAKVKQEIDYGTEKMEIDSDFVIRVTYDPFVMHQKGSSSFGSESMNTEMYVTDDDMYFYLEIMDQWINFGGFMGDLMEDEVTEPMDYQTAHDQLVAIENSLEYFTIEETGDAYVLHLYADGDESKDAYSKLIEQSSGNLEELVGEDLSMSPSSQVEELEYIMEIDKNTYETSSFVLNFTLSIESEGMTIDIRQNMESTYLNINNVEAIEIPEEVKEQEGSLW